jgi:hypothetical protein
LIGKFLKEDVSCKSLQPQPFFLIENIEPIPRTWIVLEKCAYVD